MSEAKWPQIPREATGARRELLEWLHEVLAERSPWRSLHEACKEVKTGVHGLAEPRLGVNKATVHRWLHDQRLPTPDSLTKFCDSYNKAVEGLDGYSPIPDDERGKALALLADARQQESPEQRLQDQRARYDALSRTAAEVQADRDGLLAELADERRTAAERCHLLEQRLRTLQAQHQRDQRHLRQQRRKGRVETSRRQQEAAAHAAAQQELSNAQRLITELRHTLTTSTEAHEQALADRDATVAEYRSELTAVRDRLATLELRQADRDAADAAVDEAIATVEQAHTELRHDPDPDTIARRDQQKEVIAQLRAASDDPKAVRRILRTVATTWTNKDIDGLVFALCFTSVYNDWGPSLARCLARTAKVRYWVPEPFSIDRLLRGPGLGTKLWCELRGVRLETHMDWPDTYFRPHKKTAGSR
ncbi:hypothetical protein [Streptomyces bungoensis]|uniref:hypothetical protein n=1 Tax=Streptomyces bungoensis TaxID=285568 RepID=UPI0033C971DE